MHSRGPQPALAGGSVRNGNLRVRLSRPCLAHGPGRSRHCDRTALHAGVRARSHSKRRHFLPKPVDRARLKRALDDISALYDQRRRVRALEEQLLKDLEFHGIVGKSPATLEVFDFARKVARHYTNVLVVGQTGTGKELVARAIHQLSPVSSQRLAVCNCSALVDTPLESQLFGHLRGSFTGATDSRPGLFEYANGGTVFLDEIRENSLAMQAKLLRAIQNREIQRVGSPEVKQINVRVIAATNRDLRAEVLAGRFREDLFYRLSSIQIRIPPLSERLEDLPLLVQFFLKKYNEAYNKKIPGLARRAQAVLLQHPWPGNVRELENVISSARRPPAISSISTPFPRTCNNATRLARALATNGLRSRWKRSARSTFSGCWRCAREIVCARRRSSASVAPDFIGISSATTTTTGRRTPSEPRPHEALFRTGTHSRPGTEMAPHRTAKRRKQSTCPFETLASALHSRSALRTTQSGSVRNC